MRGGGSLTTRYPAPALAPGSDAELTAVHFTMTEGETPVSRDIPVGFYTVTFSFYNDATQDEAHKLFSCSQTINIYKNLETNWWKNSTAGATYISNKSGTFTLSPDVIRRYARHNFYVDPQRGSDTNAGSWYDPFDSVKTAVKKICNTNDGEPYTVSLLSDDTDASGDAYTTYINIDPAAALTLTILGRDDNDGNVLRTINAARTPGKTGRVMYIGSNATVTLSNIGITGGYASDNGGGVYVDGGTFTMTGGAISGCTATGSGGGIYIVGSGSCTLDGCVVQDNTSTGGNGAVYISGSSTADAVLNVSGAAKITGTGTAQTVYLATLTSAVVITGELTEPVVAKIHSAEYTSAPAVLKDNTDDGSLVKAHYARFQSDHAGYSIYDDGVLRLPPTEGGVVTEEHTCTFSLDKTEITASGNQTLTVTATVTTTGQDGTTQKTFSGADLNWATIQVFCEGYEITDSNMSGFKIENGIITIPANAKAETYKVKINAAYTCEFCGRTKQFDGELEFVITADSSPEGFVRVNGGTVVGKNNTNNYPGVFIAGRTVTLKSFYMCDHEVTQGEWEKAMATQWNQNGVLSTPSLCSEGSTEYAVTFGTEQNNRPVDNVTWYDAVYYCNIRSEQEGLTKAYDISNIQQSGGHITSATVSLVSDADGYRLPTEAEWEYAARGGDPNAAAWDYTFSGAATASGVAHTNSSNAGMDSVGWYCWNNKDGTTGAAIVTGDASGKGTHEVKQKKANALGIYDMSGNVYEWCWDWFGTVASDTPATGSASGSNRVYRGGAWSSNAFVCSVSYQGSNSPSIRSSNVGFRVVRSVSQ